MDQFRIKFQPVEPDFRQEWVCCRGHCIDEAHFILQNPVIDVETKQIKLIGKALCAAHARELMKAVGWPE